MNRKRQQLCIYFLLLAGAIFRIVPWLQNRALWFDEALLANNLLDRSFLELLQPMANNQSAPIAYLWLVKLLTLILGESEWVLRLPSLIAGLGALYLFYRLAGRLFQDWWVCWALAFFAFCDPHIYYSSELKQYAFDVIIAISISLATLPLFRQQWSLRAMWLLGGIGIVAVWFSQPAVFVLAGAGLGLLAFHWKTSARALVIIGWGAAWLGSFGVYYLGFLNQDIGNDHLQLYHQDYFMPLAFWKAESWEWYWNQWFGAFRFPAGILFKYPAGILGLIGLLIVPRWWKSHWLLLFFPYLLAIIASGFQLYSTLSRLMLFAAPTLILLLVQGLRHVDHFFEDRQSAQWPRIVLNLLGALLLLQPLLNSIQRLTTSNEINAIKPVLEKIRVEKQKGEILYLNPGAVPQFQYYKNRYALEELPVIYGLAPWEDWKKDIDRLLIYPAAWCLFSHDERNGSSDQQTFGAFFGKYGRIDHEIRTKGSGCFRLSFED